MKSTYQIVDTTIILTRKDATTTRADVIETSRVERTSSRRGDGWRLDVGSWRCVNGWTVEAAGVVLAGRLEQRRSMPQAFSRQPVHIRTLVILVVATAWALGDYSLGASNE